MRNKLASTIGCALLLCAPFVSLAQQKPLTNAYVISMVKGGLAESVVISAIQVNPANYDISPAALLALKKAGVTVKLVRVPGGDHGSDFPDNTEKMDWPAMALEWFDTYLIRKPRCCASGCAVVGGAVETVRAIRRCEDQQPILVFL